jgi:2-keto-myo-inositol isomerase
MNEQMSRRAMLAAAGVAVGVGMMKGTGVARAADAAAAGPAKDTFNYCLNTSTIQGQKLSLYQQIDVASKAGYNAIELWYRDIDAYVKQTGPIPELKKRLEDGGLVLEDVISFPKWIVDDPEARKQGLEAAKREFDIVKRIGGKRMAAPPVGATDQPNINLLQVAKRYKDLCDVAQTFDITTMVEMWGFSKCLNKLGEVTLVAAESGHRNACVLPDVYHFHKGGSDFNGLRLLSAGAVQVFHMNDYPAEPAPDQIKDEHRIYPGDGVAPLTSILKDVRAVNPNCVLSLELFNRELWKQDALVVAKTGLEKMKAAVAKSLA